MKTITIQIGNSDDTLTQADWARFVDAMTVVLFSYQVDVHFFGGSINWARWQNACWVFNCDAGKTVRLKEAVAAVGNQYQQQSVAWTEGETIFI